jgi:hypothetical protein
MRGNEDHSSRVQIAFLISQVNVNASFFDPQDFILFEVLVPGKFVSRSHVLCAEDEALRTIVFRADLQHEVPMVRFSPQASLTLVSLEQQGLCGSPGCGCGIGSD